jgi:arylsulfatase A-like enzyme
VGDWVGAFASLSDPHRPDASVGPVSPEALQRARAGYYGHMSHIDHQVNRFLGVLQEHRLHEATWICFTSDHGEMMGDHHFFRKSMPYEGSARIPMVLAGPPTCGIRPGTAATPVVELRDVMPTLLDCAGLPAPESVEGRSFLPFARGETAPWREYLHGEHALWNVGGSAHWITDGQTKYAWFSQSGMEQLFDLRSDPQELHDLARDPSAAQALARLRGHLVKELAGREEGFVDGTKLVAGRPTASVLSHLR